MQTFFQAHQTLKQTSPRRPFQRGPTSNTCVAIQHCPFLAPSQLSSPNGVHARAHHGDGCFNCCSIGPQVHSLNLARARAGSTVAVRSMENNTCHIHIAMCYVDAGRDTEHVCGEWRDRAGRLSLYLYFEIYVESPRWSRGHRASERRRMHLPSRCLAALLHKHNCKTL